MEDTQHDDVGDVGRHDQKILRPDRRDDGSLTVCLVGAGRRAEILARALPHDVKVSHVFARTEDSAERLARKLDAIPLAVDALTNNYSDKIAIIAAPIPVQGNLISTCLQLYKHVFVEKPGPMWEFEADELRKLAKKNACVVRVGYSWLDEAWNDILPNAPFDHIEVRWNRAASDGDNELNLVSHPIAWLLSKAGKTKLSKVEKHISASGGIYIYKLEWETRQTAFLRVQLDELRCEREIEVRFKSGAVVTLSDDGKSLSSAPNSLSSAERQVRSFIDDVRRAKQKGVRDLKFAGHVLKTLSGVT